MVHRLFRRNLLAGLALFALAACGIDERLPETPTQFGDFQLGFTVVVTDGMQKGPISRTATGEEWEAALKAAIEERFGRYEGGQTYHIAIAVNGYALAPRGVPIVYKPQSVLFFTPNLWTPQGKMNREVKRLQVYEGISGDGLVLGTGYTRTKEEQMQVLARNAAGFIEDWFLENPEWFDGSVQPVPPEQLGAGSATAPAISSADPGEGIVVPGFPAAAE